MWVAFRSSGFPAAPSIRPQLAHTAPIGPVWGFSGVHSLPGPQIRTQALTRPFSLCPYLLYFSPTGKSWVDLAPVLPIPPRSAHNCPTRLQQGGEPVSLVLLLYPTLKTAHRGEFGFHLRFLACFCSGSVAKSRSSLKLTAS